MREAQHNKINFLISNKKRSVGAFFRRMRNGVPVYEVRFDGLCGALRTAAGGSSVQNLMIIDSGKIKTRRMTPREYARAMGLEDSFHLPEKRSAAYTFCGDGLAAPIVQFLAKNLIHPLLAPTAGDGEN